MFAKFLKLLSWVGLWRAPMVVLNDNAPAINLTTTPTQMVDMTARFMDVLVDNFVSEDRQKVSYLALEQSTFYKRNFDEFGSLLKNVDPLQMNDTERKSFFINLYNLLTIHSLLHMDSLPQSTLSVTDFWQRYYYKVGRYTLHLDDMEHGILRGNRPHPTSGDIMFKRNDPRLALTLPADPRIHGALNCGALSCPPLTWYDSSHLDQELDDALRGFCNKGVKTVSGSTLLINSIFDWFRSDFAVSEALTLRWLANCVDDPAISEALLKAAEDEHYFTYHYDWTLNAVSGGGGGRVKVTVYFESLCSDSMKFFRDQLYPTWRDLQDIMDLEFVPFGKATATPTGTGDYEMECQHGPNECFGNKVMACAQNSLTIATQMELFHCMMTKPYPAFTGEQCSREVGVDWAPIDECSKSTVGSGLLYKNGVRTSSLKPRVYFIPTVTIDGHYNRNQLGTSLGNLKTQICEVYQGPPHQNCL